MRVRLYLFAWFISSISLFILTELNFVNINNSILYSQEFEQPLNLRKGDNWLEIKKGDQIYVRSYEEGLFNNKVLTNLPGGSIFSGIATVSTFLTIDHQKKVLITDQSVIMFSDLYSVSPIADKTMSSKLAKDKATKGFCIGFVLPFITVTMEGGGDFQYLGPMLLFSTAFGAMIGLGSGIFGAAQGTLYPDIIEEFIIGPNDWSILKERISNEN